VTGILSSLAAAVREVDVRLADRVSIRVLWRENTGSVSGFFYLFDSTGVETTSCFRRRIFYATALQQLFCRDRPGTETFATDIRLLSIYGNKHLQKDSILFNVPLICL